MSISVKKLKDLKIFLHRHRSAQEVVLSYCGKSYKDIKGDKEFFLQKSDIYDKGMNIKMVIEAMKERGLWGYCCYSKGSDYREIHYWIDKGKVGLEDIGELLCHEMAHAAGIKSENYAMRYAYVASIVIQLLMKDFVLKGKK